MPRMLHDVVSELLGAEKDMRIVASSVSEGDLGEDVQREHADVVVVAVPSGDPPRLCDELMSRFPRLIVVALEDRGQHGSVYLPRPMRFRFSELSGAGLVDAIRGATRNVPLTQSVREVNATELNAMRESRSP